MAEIKKRVHVAVGVVRNAKGEILIAERAEHLHQGGLWEFPGGKVEEGETVQQALHRELKEELGIESSEYQPLVKINHNYSDKSVLLDVWTVNSFMGTPKGLQGQPLEWVSLGQLRQYKFPAANQAIITILRLPREMMITGLWKNEGEFAQRLERALENGVRLVQLRAHQCSDDQYVELFNKTKKICKKYKALLIANTSQGVFKRIEADGLHLTSARLMQIEQRSIPSNKFLGASCHNIEEIKLAEKIGADYITLGPVFQTATHLDVKPLGAELFIELSSQATMPVFALGGIDKDNHLFVGKEVFGVAGIRNWW